VSLREHIQANPRARGQAGEAEAVETRVPPRVATQLLAAAVVAADIIATLASMIAAHFVRFKTGWFDNAPLFHPASPGLDAYFGLFGFGLAVLIGLLASFGSYEPANIVDSRRTPLPILRALFWWAVIYLGASLALKFDPPVSRAYIVLSFLFAACGLTVHRLLFQLWIKKTNPTWLQPRLLFVGCPENHPAAREFLAHTSPPPLSIGWLCAAPAEIPPSPEALAASVRSHDASMVVIDHNHLGMDEVIRLAAECERLYVEYRILPGYSQVFASKFRVEVYGKVALLSPRILPLDLWRNRFLKRTLDFAGAALGLLLLSPLISLLAIVIKIVSPGPAFFAQVRYGRRGVPFKMLKLRTMHPGSEMEDHANLSTLPGDPRLHPFGQFLRKWDLDELPQLVNVLLGQMSLIGPRPERVFHADRLADEIAHYQFRHSIKPGMTGWAQVNGLRGDTDFNERIRMDIHYIENWSLLLDAQILLMTIFQKTRLPGLRRATS
jgi:exopolysaccharide biosynthesis polyprenyl glycosylphosphotransferase